MANLETTKPITRKGRISKKSVHIDFTPMVDLGFLLLTFFILTTTLIQQKHKGGVNLFLADNTIASTPTNVNGSQLLTILLNDAHKINYYFGIDSTNCIALPDDKNSLQQLLANHKKNIAQKINQGKLAQTDSALVNIKPSENCNYEDVVNVLDAATVNQISNVSIDGM